MNICRTKFNVSFPISKKVVVNGHAEHPLFTLLKSEMQDSLGFRGIRWNFEKFVLSRSGKVVHRFSSRVTPLEFEHLVVELLDDKMHS